MHGSVPPAALVCTGTVLLHFITGNLRARGADYYLTSLTIVMHREDLRDLLRQYSSTRPDYMFPMVRDGSVELFKHVMNMITSHPSALESPSRDSAL